MFKKQYSQFCDSITPSQALSDETLALMQEAQNHKATAPNLPLKWKTAARKPAVLIPVAATALAAVVALVIVGAWTHHGNPTDVDEYGDVFSDGSIEGSEDVFDSLQDSSTSNSVPPKEESSPTEDQPPADGSDNMGSSADTEDSADAERPSEEQEPPAETPQDPSDESTSNANPPNSAEDGENQGDPSPNEPNEEDQEVILENSDPYGPEISTEKNTATYLSIREFIDALTAKDTPNYGKNYYNARELLIVPNLLPDGARFRHLYLNTRNGKYSYSYHFTKDGKDYIIDIEVNAVVPKTLNELRLYKEHIATETVLDGKKEDQLFYQFGEQDLVTVTLTDTTATTPLTEEETAALLTQFKLERCSLNNPVLDMKY